MGLSPLPTSTGPGTPISHFCYVWLLTAGLGATLHAPGHVLHRRQSRFDLEQDRERRTKAITMATNISPVFARMYGRGSKDVGIKGTRRRPSKAVPAADGKGEGGKTAYRGSKVI